MNRLRNTVIDAAAMVKRIGGPVSGRDAMYALGAHVLRHVEFNFTFCFHRLPIFDIRLELPLSNRIKCSRCDYGMTINQMNLSDLSFRGNHHTNTTLAHQPGITSNIDRKSV